MPNFDGGQYFLTALFPIRDGVVAEEGGPPRSHLQALREELDLLPKARQSEATVGAKVASPFARSNRTHFARFVIIDDTIFNGRDSQDALVNAARATPLTEPRPVDHLRRPYLAFVADFDAPDGAPTNLDAYLKHLWEVMEPELRAVFRHCLGFVDVANAASFAAFVRRGQIETTMSYNDYWTGTPPLKPAPIPMAAAPVALFGLGFLVGLVALFGRVLGDAAAAAPWGLITPLGLGAVAGGLAPWALKAIMAKPAMAEPDWDPAPPWLTRARPFLLIGGGLAVTLAILWRWKADAPWLAITLWMLFLTVAALAGFVAFVTWRGRRPFPRAPGSDLPSVLKALYLQRTFGDFAVAHQGASPEALHAAFGAFLETHKPDNVGEPTQPPGVVPQEGVSS